MRLIASIISAQEERQNIYISSPSKSAPIFLITDNGNLIDFVFSTFMICNPNDSSLNVGYLLVKVTSPSINYRITTSPG